MGGMNEDDVDTLIEEARKFANASPLGKSMHRELDKGILLVRRLADALEDAEQDRIGVTSQRNRAYRQRDEERAAKEGNIRHLNAALATIEKVRATLGPNVVFAPDEEDEHLVDEAASYVEGAEHVRGVILAILSEAPVADPAPVTDERVRAALREWYMSMWGGGWTEQEERRMRRALEAAREAGR